MPPISVIGDNALHDSPHCHAPIHPPAPTPTPVPHPPIPLSLIGPPVPTVMAGSKPVLTVTGNTIPCMIPPCVPGGPGMIAKGSMTVLTGGKPTARVTDMVAFTSCVAPIPSPTGKIIGPGVPTVLVGG
jgi:uncharacterized Zn-binding protein involved in type VI secretion